MLSPVLPASAEAICFGEAFKTEAEHQGSDGFRPCYATLRTRRPFR